MVDVRSLGGDGFERLLAISSIVEAADGVELAEVHRKDHHGSIRGLRCQRVRSD